MRFNAVQEVVEDIKNGRMVVIVDDEDRENEGDLIMAASKVTPTDINFMARYGRGLICLPMEAEWMKRLGINPMVAQPKDSYKTAWAVSIDASEDITTGISAHDRARTVSIASDPNSKSSDFIQPGHVFPLRAQEGGVLVRAGHTEACVDLMELAGVSPVGIICEIMNDDGSMARTPELMKFAKDHGLKICSVAELIKFRMQSEKLVSRITETVLPTEFGDFRLILYKSAVDDKHHLALVKGELSADVPALVRVHSECLTGDVFKSKRCDCGRQLEVAMRRIQKEGSGVILYMNQEGRGIGLPNKIKAYALQDRGMDTVEANVALGFKPDLRDYGIGAQMLVDLGLRRIKILTNNPQKIVALEGYGLEIEERVAIEVSPNEASRKYLTTKKIKLGHYLEKV